MSENTTVWVIDPDVTWRLETPTATIKQTFDSYGVVYDDGTNVLLAHPRGGPYNAIASNKASFNSKGPKNVRIHGVALLVPSEVWNAR